MAVSEERASAISIFNAELLTVGAHTVLTVAGGGDHIAKPAGATHLKLQALTQNIRYTIDNNPVTTATATVGFQLAAGSDTLLPVPNAGVSVAREANGATIQYQWMK